MGLGSITLGYNYDVVNQAIKKQVDQRILFSLPHTIEVELSELVRQIIPFADMVKFEKLSKIVTVISFSKRNLWGVSL